jgi:hypothetical protein
MRKSKGFPLSRGSFPVSTSDACGGFRPHRSYSLSGRGGEPVDLDQCSPVPGGFVLQLAHELAPSHVADTLGETVVLEHVLDRKALDAHHLVFVDDARRELVLVIAPPVSDTGVYPGHLEPRPGTVTTAFSLLGEPPLRLCQLLLVFGEIPGIADGLSRREDDHRGQARPSTSPPAVA